MSTRVGRWCLLCRVNIALVGSFRCLWCIDSGRTR